jgi:hypothetical protein
MKKKLRVMALVCAFALAGCRAHMATIKLVNTSSQPISTIIVDYPSATFGKDKLAPGETFSSPVKLTDTGAMKVQFTDAQGASHNYTGPILHPNEEGSIEIRLDQNSAVFTPGAAGR